MSELTLTVMRLGFLAVLWLFVIVAVQVIRSDLFGTRVTQRDRVGRPPGPQQPGRQQARQQAAPPQQRGQQGGGRLVGRNAPHQAVVVTEGTLTGTTVALQGQTITLGRAHDSTIVLDDDYASSRHARIYPDRDGQWIIEDLGSTNGTYLDRSRLTTPHRSRWARRSASARPQSSCGSSTTMSERSEHAEAGHTQASGALPTGGWAVWLDTTGCTRSRRARCA